MSTEIATPVSTDFEDLVPKYSAAGYMDTNEEPELHQKLLRGIKIDRGVAIASGGEVAFFAILPRVMKELILVDHSYLALSAAYHKRVVLEAYGPQRTKELFESGNTSVIKEAFEGIESRIPEALRKPPKSTQSSYYSQSMEYKASFVPANLRTNWHFGSLRSLSDAAKKLSKLRFVHADIADLADRGPFDFAYISNAPGHTGRSGEYLGKVRLRPMLSPGAHVLSTSSLQNWGWKLIESIRGYRTSWIHELYEVTD